MILNPQKDFMYLRDVFCFLTRIYAVYTYLDAAGTNISLSFERYAAIKAGLLFHLAPTGKIEFVKVKSEDQATDSLTKPFQTTKHYPWSSQIKLVKYEIVKKMLPRKVK